jgi:ankyrin repeat protein
VIVLLSLVRVVAVVTVVAAAGVVLAACSSSSSAPRAGEPVTSQPGPSEAADEESTAESTKDPTVATPSSPGPAEQARLDAQLIEAAWDNDVDRAARLIERGGDANAQDETQQSAFLIAASEGHVALLDLAMEHGADLDSKDAFNGTALIRATERGHAEIAGRLVRAGVDVDHVNNLGWTALHESVILGDGSERYVDTVRVLVAAGADVTIPTVRDGLTAGRHAEQMGQTEIAGLLEQAAAADPVRRPVAGTRLLAAAADGDADDVALALRSKADLEVRDDRERTALLLAATYDRVAVARLLVMMGADPDALDDRHDTPWLVTGVTGSVAMLETLLPADPDLTIRNRFGGISVIPASERGHVEYVRRVVQTDIDVNHVNDLGWTALLEAVILGDGSAPYQEIVRILLGAGADPAIADGNGVTALEHAASTGQDDVAAILRARS